jgi:hypothetical protein
MKGILSLARPRLAPPMLVRSSSLASILYGTDMIEKDIWMREEMRGEGSQIKSITRHVDEAILVLLST